MSGAALIVVAAPPDAPLDPENVAWMQRVETDDEGGFEISSAPVGQLRVVVMAGGYARLERSIELESEGSEIVLFVAPERNGPYRTVVETERQESWTEVPAQDTLDGQQARHYPGSGGDPMLAALNFPGIVRSPGGLGLLAFRGGDPREVGVYVDGHPVPRGFHVIPIASVVSPPMVADIELSPGNYAANYGGYGGGLVQISSRQGRRDGVHGEAHLDLFDVGATTQAAVGKGSVHIGVRRSHLGEVLDAVLPILDLKAAAPNFWDYLSRFDQPLRNGHSIALRAFGAGDRLSLSEYFDFRSSFHRFDFDYRYTKRAWKILVSPSVRLDRTTLETGDEARFARRGARVYSFRAAFVWQASEHVALDFGADAIAERWHRTQEGQTVVDEFGGFTYGSEFEASKGAQARVGAWLAVPIRVADWSLIPSLRLNVFDYGPKPSVRVDPRIHVRGPLSQSVQLIAAAGMYAIPVVGARKLASDGAIAQGSDVGGSVVDIPQYLITYFDPNVGGEVNGRFTSATYVTHASLGFEAELPWDLELRALGFWRSALAKKFDIPPTTPDELYPGYYGRRRATGIELLLRRTAARGVLDGWIGYTLLWSRIEDQPDAWLPAVFDQRHNLVSLLSVALPRGFRVGLRFRLGSGNPMTPVIGRDIVQVTPDSTFYVPIRGPRGLEYQPLFHQLDVRVDKTWVRNRTTISTYFDVQNIYNHWYPEFWIYSADWSAREQAIGLPIYPSLGVSVMY